jgi:hypothetical protein
MTKIEEMRDTLLCDMERELERVKADNAALRGAIELKINGLSVVDYLDQQFPGTKGHLPIRFYLERLNSILSTTEPPNYVSKDAVRPLAECLHLIKETALNARCEPSITVAAMGLSACGGVGIARKLGLLDK